MADARHGWLFKWTNYLRGYQKRWFVLSNGLLSYYRNQAEMAHTCRGTINVTVANVDKLGSCNFVVSNASSGGTQTYYLRATNESEADLWITALRKEKKKAAAPVLPPVEENEDVAGSGEDFGALTRTYEEMRTHSDLLNKHSQSVSVACIDLKGESSEAFRPIQEKMALFKISANALTKVCGEFVGLARKYKDKIQGVSELERELESTVETLARQQHRLQVQCKKEVAKSQGGDDDEEEDDDNESYFDAVEEAPRSAELWKPESPLTGSSLIPPFTLKADDIRPKKRRRLAIAPRPSRRLNLWSLMKNCIGKDLSKIPLPVNINEPLSFTQRMTEDLEYSSVLDKAAMCKDSLEQMAYIAAFTVSGHTNGGIRLSKPFNALLGETFEYEDTGNRGWRGLAEQVGHHPPETAIHAEHKDWLFWQDFAMGSKFRGQYLQIIPQGYAHVVFNGSGHHYGFRRGVTPTVHNIIIGKLYIDQPGEFEIVNYSTKETCYMKFHAYSYFSKEEPRRVTGVVYDAEKQPRYTISGVWDKQIQFARIKESSSSTSQKASAKKMTFVTENPVLAWSRDPRRPGAEAMYELTDFSCSLNEMEEGVAPTDSRQRPDQRLMENGEYDAANAKKYELEEKQRKRRRERVQRLTREWEAAGNQGKPDLGSDGGWKPTWFEKEMDPLTKTMTYVYKGGYWEAKQRGDWSEVPDIFS